MSAPAISAVVRAYDAEAYVGETIAAILAQTRPPLEVIVVDDGSTDGTAAELSRFGDEIRVVRQANGGCASALNRGFAEARGEFVANCDADDVWVVDKLERQLDALGRHPDIDLAFGFARIFGEVDGRWALAEDEGGAGILDPGRFGRSLFARNPICPSSTLVRRDLYRLVGPFRDMLCEDYDWWMRALAARAVFYYDPETLVHYRRHGRNVSGDQLELHRSDFLARSLNTEIVEERSFVQKVLAVNLFHIGRDLSDLGFPREARNAFLDALRFRFSLRGIAWVLVLSMPEPLRRHLASGLVALKRAVFGPPSALSPNSS